jgi:NitT/TauT family transport system substrate-binding protein
MPKTPHTSGYAATGPTTARLHDHQHGQARTTSLVRTTSAVGRACASALRQALTTLAAVLVAVAVAATAAGCGAAPASPAGGGLEQTHLTVAVLPATDDAPFWLALKNGFFRQQGLSVTPKIVAQSTLAIPAMVHGSVQVIGGGNYVTFFEAQARGVLDIKVIAAAGSCTPDDFAVLALPRSGITSPADLAGKIIAVGLTNSISTLTINAMLKVNGVRPASVKYVAVPYPDMAAALKSGAVDAISAVEPFLTGAEESLGANVILPQCQGPTANLPLSGYFATAAWTAKNPRTARAFARAIERAQALADRDRAAVEQILPTYIKISRQTAALVNLNAYPTTLDRVQIQRVADLMAGAGLLRKPLDVAPLLLG